MTLPVQFKGNGVDTILRIENTFSGQEYYIDLGYNVDSVKFDPDMWIVSKNTVTYDDSDNKLNFTIAPNPALDEINIRFYSNIYYIQDVEIFDYLGNCVYNKCFDNTLNTAIKINVTLLQKGCYFVKANINGNYITNKFIKN